MSDLPHKHLFVSYSSEDRNASAALVARIFRQITGLKHALRLQGALTLEVFIDQHRLAAGDQWGPAIERALESADLALLLLSPNFFASDFIMEHELPRLRERSLSHEVRLIPVLLHAYALDQLPWLAATEMRPRGGLSLSDVEAAGPAKLDRVLADLTSEIAAQLQAAPNAAAFPVPTRSPVNLPAHASGKAPAVIADPPPTTAGATDPAVLVLAATLWHDLGEQRAASLAQQLVAGVARSTGLAAEALFRAVRFCIEFQLLVAEDPTSPTALQALLGAPDTDESANRLLAALRERARSGDFSCTPIEVNSFFFAHTRAREVLWKAYFDAVLEAGVDEFDREQLASLCPIRVQYGFLASQHLVAGLMSRFDDDWRPVLNAYQRAIPDPRRHRSAFQSLQASQWNCWLVWGPSIPVCNCSQWHGVHALQYGYGDENNSIPVVDLGGEAGGPPRQLDPIASTFDAEGRGAKWVQLTGRLRWGPWYLREAGGDAPAEGQDEEFDLAAADEIRQLPKSSRRAAAPAQASLFREDGFMFRHDSDGITLQVETVDRVSNESRVYFSAYLWMIFLVTGSVDEPGIGPRRLGGKPWPSGASDQRGAARKARLWEDLLPVFVHANIADPAALEVQKRVLAQSAITLLQQVWARRDELFEAGDAQAGIRFHLVSASDYSGCGSVVRFPIGTRLTTLLRERLDLEPDRAFADAVAVPAAAGDPNGRSPALARYFSSCHLPELVADYFDAVEPRDDHRSKAR
ncbi:MAG: TIR domain-containing protein [Burkholderiaceae bacterium]|nr:TIR domain-containing protein [Burkholderiaceae bacterium]